MKSKNTSFLIIGKSLFFAAAILISSYLQKNTQYEQHSDTVMYILIALWFITNSILSRMRRKDHRSIKSEYLCLKRKVSGIFNWG